MKKPRAVVVTWVDHYHFAPGRWVDLSEITDVSGCEVITCGFLVRKNKRTLTLAQSVTEANDATGVFVILRSDVTSMKSL